MPKIRGSRSANKRVSDPKGVGNDHVSIEKGGSWGARVLLDRAIAYRMGALAVQKMICKAKKGS